MVKVLQIFYNCALCFQFEYRIVALADKWYQVSAQPGQPVYSQRIGELAGTNTKKLVRLKVQGFIKLCKKPVYIDIVGKPGGIEICLQDTVDAVNRTVAPGIQYLVITAGVFPGSGTWLKENTPVCAKVQLSLAMREVAYVFSVQVIGL